MGVGDAGQVRAVHVGRVGALAVALGVGLAIASCPAMPRAGADSGASSTSSSSSSAESAGDTDSGESGVAGPGVDDDTTSEPEADPDEPDAEVVDTEIEVEVEDTEDAEDPEVGDVEEERAGRDRSDDATPDVDDEPEQLGEAPEIAEPAAEDTADAPPTDQPDDNADVTTEPAVTEVVPAAAEPEPEESVPAPAASRATAMNVATVSASTVTTGAPWTPGHLPNLLTILAGVFRDFQRTFFNFAPDARNQRLALTLATTGSVSEPMRFAAKDFDGDTLTFSVLAGRGPQHGTIVIDQATGTFTYDPDDAFARTGGTDTFTYKVSDHASGPHLPNLFDMLTKPDFGHADIATVTIIVAPVVDPVNSGIDLSGVDPSIRPQDDLYGYLTGKWLREHEIPGDRSSDNTFREISDRTNQQIRDLIAELGQTGAAHGTDAQRIVDLYASFMDTDTLRDVGLAPLLAELAAIDGAVDGDALAAVLGSLARAGLIGGFEVGVGADPKNSTRNLLGIDQAGLGLPDEAYYRDPQYAAVLAAYPGHIARMFALTYGGSADDYAETAAAIVALETRLAASHWDVTRSRDAELTYNPMTIAQLKQSAPGFDWTGWLNAYGLSEAQAGTVVVSQPDYLTAFAAAWTDVPQEDWRAWAAWRLIHERQFLVTDELNKENFAFYDTLLWGTEQQPARWERGLSLLDSLLGNAVGKLYVERHFPAEAKQRMETMVSNLMAAYRVSITELDWMSPETKAKALEKLDKIGVKIGYPETWTDYSGLEIDGADLYGNYLRASEAGTVRMLDRLAKPVDPTRWTTNPHVVNAFYSPVRNDITFPAGILQSPLFDLTADDAASYGAIGAVIGHEIGHAFDDQGSKYDGDGNLSNWWTAADRAEFEARAAGLVAQYNGFTPRQLPDSYHVNGALTLGENIADQAGLTIALKAYELSLGGADAPTLDGFTGVQRVFLGWAQGWKNKSRDAEVIQFLATDPHSPMEFRVNGVVRNIDAFYEAFGVTEGDALYLAPQDRVQIWF
ncbi:endothelin-converting enzyme [Mycolicibacterium tokaiense]|uniref:Endothelin-converting enzyme n=2 Tax=Mycolicibacterium tokaiense TaxID=39695 RepID=A0A378TAJ8_9MYCO|nr:hypothetical protein MTOK_43640 [Mycolicibacterium tokaiense]STZ56895.1 endothelin-converting enzyme [Mycolicibacterium tokaiense]